MNNIFKNVVVLFSSQLLGYAISLAILPYISRTLGVNSFAQWSFSMNAMGYIAVLLEFGFILYGAKAIASSPNDAGKIAGSIYLAKLFLAIIALIIVSIVPNGIASKDVWFAAFFVVISQTISPIWLYQGLGYARHISIFGVLAQLFGAILIITFVKSEQDTALALLINAICFLFFNILSILYAFKKFNIKIEFSKKFYTIYIDAKNIFLSSIAISIYISMIGVVVGYTYTSDESGQFFGAQKIALIINSLFVPLSQAIYPMMAAEKNTQTLKKILFTSIVLVGLCSVILFAFSDFFVFIILGSKFHEAGELLKYFAFAPLFVALNTVLGTLGLIALGYEKQMRQISIRAAIISLPLAIVLCNTNIYAVSLYMITMEAFVFVQLLIKTKKLGII